MSDGDLRKRQMNQYSSHDIRRIFVAPNPYIFSEIPHRSYRQTANFEQWLVLPCRQNRPHRIMIRHFTLTVQDRSLFHLTPGVHCPIKRALSWKPRREVQETRGYYRMFAPSSL